MDETQNQPQNAVIGDISGFGLPQSRVDETELAREKNLARFSRTKEYQQLKKHLESRIKTYQTWLPDGRSMPKEAQMAELAFNWKVANAIIGEFQTVLAIYDSAKEVVDASEKAKNTDK